MRAYSYIRFSYTRQALGDSVRRQLELARQYAERHQLELDNSLHLRDLGISAFDRSNLTRGALAAFLQAVKRGRVPRGSYLLVEAFDRLSRAEVPVAVRLLLDLTEAGITVVTLIDEKVWNRETVATSGLSYTTIPTACAPGYHSVQISPPEFMAVSRHAQPTRRGQVRQLPAAPAGDSHPFPLNRMSSVSARQRILRRLRFCVAQSHAMRRGMGRRRHCSLQRPLHPDKRNYPRPATAYARPWLVNSQSDRVGGPIVARQGQVTWCWGLVAPTIDDGEPGPRACSSCDQHSPVSYLYKANPAANFAAG